MQTQREVKGEELLEIIDAIYHINEAMKVAMSYQGDSGLLCDFYLFLQNESGLIDPTSVHEKGTSARSYHEISIKSRGDRAPP